MSTLVDDFIFQGELKSRFCYQSVLIVVLSLGLLPNVNAGINDGLLASYSFEGNGNDSSGNNLNGTIYGNTSTIPGVSGNALYFNRAYMILPNVSQLSFGTGSSFSVSLWFKSAPVSTWMQYLAIITTYRSFTSKNWVIVLTDNYNGSYQGYVNGGVTDSTAGAGIRSDKRLDDNQWHHLVLIRDANTRTVSFYVDGVRMREGTTNDLSQDIRSGQPISIGNHLERLYNFSMDELKIYGRPLTEEEVLCLGNKEACSPLCQLYGVHDDHLNDSQLFTVSAKTLEVKPLGDLYVDYDIESMDIHPKTQELYAASSDNTFREFQAISSEDVDRRGHLYQVNKANGQLKDLGQIRTPVQSFKEVDALSFHPDGTLWGWSQDAGLFRVNHITDPLDPNEVELVIPKNGVATEVEEMTWNKAGTILYGAENLHGDHDPDSHGIDEDAVSISLDLPRDPDKGVRLWAYSSNNITTICDNVMGSLEEIEALETLPDDTLLFGFHGIDTLVIGVIDPKNCEVLVKKEIPTPYNDIEGFAWPGNCAR